MTSPKLSVGNEYYIPFWVILEYLDTAPPDPFIKVKVLSINTMSAISNSASIQVECCDLICNNKQQLIAYNIPSEYLINQDDLDEWAQKISDWFLNYCKIKNV